MSQKHEKVAGADLGISRGGGGGGGRIFKTILKLFLGIDFLSFPKPL